MRWPFWVKADSRPSSSSFTVACVIDNQPRFHVEAVLWAICAMRYLPRERFRVVVYLVDNAPGDLVEWLSGRGLEVRTTGQVASGSPHCNKIAPFLDRHKGDAVIVTDVDLYFVDDPSKFLNSTRFRAPPNNHCNPPPHIFKTILAEAGLGREYRPGMALCAGPDGMRETHLNNICGSFVVVPAERAIAFAKLWRKWALWLLCHRSLLSRWAVHVDQVAFALALEELGEDVEFLPPQTNTILHIFEEIASVYAFHLSTGHIPQFPSRFRSDKTLVTDSLDEGAAAAVNRLNVAIIEAMAEIAGLPSLSDHADKFLNPAWRRQ